MDKSKEIPEKNNSLTMTTPLELEEFVNSMTEATTLELVEFALVQIVERGNALDLLAILEELPTTLGLVDFVLAQVLERSHVFNCLAEDFLASEQTQATEAAESESVEECIDKTLNTLLDSTSDDDVFDVDFWCNTQEETFFGPDSFANQGFASDLHFVNTIVGINK